MPTSDDLRKLMDAATISVRNDRYRGVPPRLAEGEVHCPVCHCPALHYPVDAGARSLYLHAGRAFPCASSEQVLTMAEIVDAIPPVRWGL